MAKFSEDDFINIMVCPRTHKPLIPQVGTLVSAGGEKNVYTKINGIYDLAIDIGPSCDKQKWEKGLDKIGEKRQQDSNITVTTDYERDISKCADFIRSYTKNKESIILDIGCGKGNMAKELSSFNYLGLDPLPPEDARYCQYFYIKAISEALPFADNSIDVIFIKDSITYCRYLDRVFYEVARVLKHNSFFVITEFVGPCFHKPLVKFLRRFLRKIIHKLTRKIDWEETSFKFYSRREIVGDILKIESLSIEREEYFHKDGRWYLVMRKN